MNIKDCTIFEHKRLNDFYGTLKKAVLKRFSQIFRSNKMKDNKRVKVLLKFIQRMYDKNPEIQEVTEASMIEVCAEENASPEAVFFCFSFSLLLSFNIMPILEKN